MPPSRAKSKSKVPVEVSPLHPKYHRELINHARTLERVEESFVRGRPAHGWLLTGPEGIGKATFAYALARRLLAIRTAGEGLPPPVSVDDPIARRMAEGSHSDFKAIEPEGAARIIPVEAIREVSQFFQLTAAESAWRVVIIDPAESLNINAANALLKILEEPPAHAMLLLVSHMPGKLLPTIRSRCRTLSFTPPGDTAFAQIMETLKVAIPAEDMTALHALSQGSPGVALTLHEGGALAMYRTLLDALECHPQIPLDKLLPFSESAGAKGQEQSWTVFKRLISHIQYRLLEAAAGDALGRNRPDILANPQEYAELLPQEMAVIRRVAATRPLAFWLGLWENSSRIIADADRLHLDRRHVILDCFNRLYQQPPV